MTALLLFYEFLKIGTFAIGGGYATIPFLFHLTEIYDWFTPDILTDMIAISNITPGPIGINMATYAGYQTMGVLGSLTTTLAIITAPFILTLITIYFINKFRETKIIKSVFEALRPASCALLSFVMIELILSNIFNISNSANLKPDIKALVLTAILFFLYKFTKNRPSLIIIIGAALGVVFKNLL